MSDFFGSFDLGSLDYNSLPAETQAALYEYGMFDINGNYTGSIYTPPATQPPATQPPATSGTTTAVPNTDVDGGSAGGGNTTPATGDAGNPYGLDDETYQNLVDQGIFDAEGNLVNIDGIGGGGFNFNFYNNPAAPPTENELLTDRDATFQQITNLANDLQAFQQSQIEFSNSLLADIANRREEELPDAPEQAGRVIAGGSERLGRGVFSASAGRTGLEDLRIRQR